MHLRILILAAAVSALLLAASSDCERARETRVFVCAVYTLYSCPSWILSSKACICCYSPLLESEPDLANMDPFCPFREMWRVHPAAVIWTHLPTHQLPLGRHWITIWIWCLILVMVVHGDVNLIMLKVHLRSSHLCIKYKLIATQLSFSECTRPLCRAGRGVIPWEERYKRKTHWDVHVMLLSLPFILFKTTCLCFYNRVQNLTF